MFVTVAAVTASTVGVLAFLVGLLRLGRAVGERLARATEPAPARVRPPVAPGDGFLSDEEETAQRWATEATRRDLARLEAVDRVFVHGMNKLFEQTLSQLGLDQYDRNWARVTSGDYPLVGVQ